MLQGCSFVAGPISEQSFPPLEGGGFVQVRLRLREPPPQSLEQSPQSPHLPYPPFTVWRAMVREHEKLLKDSHTKDGIKMPFVETGYVT